ncbi:hypothetical protein [Aquibacillus salsiterrae]|uniref:Uncharacterized protein n=1 Tax=Aquibacillus salsiterrae TaxID=2950439 RepID=A0A9X4AFA4_9BACI|nr:hypothetical protein [Aquibacillus salsiterrae]MDC3417656.1 hypothetical protein [Aquibacillus salsiterrae]
MSLKKTTLLIALLFTLVSPLNVFAGSGEWDYKGEQNISFIYVKDTFTDEYVATDGGNFKLDITSYETTSNSFSATIYIDGEPRNSKAITYYGTGTIEFSNIPAGSVVDFYIGVEKYDSIKIEFYD